MAHYPLYKYIFPPRPSTKIPPEALKTFEDMGYHGQPKLDGSCCEVYTDGIQVIVKNRHKESFTRMKLDTDELKKLHRGHGWMVLTGEYLNKSKRDINKKIFNDKFVIFDILVYGGESLEGTTFEYRLDLLDNLYDFDSHPYDPYIARISENVFRVETFIGDFENIWKNIVNIEMYEGWVLKRPSAKLEKGLKVENNMGWQCKCRKPTKNYSY